MLGRKKSVLELLYAQQFATSDVNFDLSEKVAANTDTSWGPNYRCGQSNHSECFQVQT